MVRAWTACGLPVQFRIKRSRRTNPWSDLCYLNIFTPADETLDAVEFRLKP